MKRIRAKDKKKKELSSETKAVKQSAPKTYLPAKASRDLVPFDPLSAFLREIQNFPRLSEDEEKELAIRFKEDKDLEAAYRLIKSNLWLVVKIARDYEAAARNLMDLIQEGNIGLMEAVKNFDPYREVRLPTYAAWWIKAYIIRYVIANWRLVKIGTTQAQRKLFFNLKKEKERLEREGFLFQPKLIAQNLNVKESEVIEMEQRMSSSDLSVDAPLGEDSDSTLLSILDSGQRTAEDILAERQLKGLVRKGLEQFRCALEPREQAILDQRIVAEDKTTLQTLSEEYSISKERVRQIEVKIMEKLRIFLKEQLGENLEDIDTIEIDN